MGAPLGRFGGVVFKDRFVRAVVDVHLQAVGSDLNIDRFLFLFLDVQKACEIPRDGFEKTLILAGDSILHAGILLSGGRGFLHNARGLLGCHGLNFIPSGVARVFKIKRDLRHDLGLFLRDKDPEHDEQRHHGGHKVGVGDLPSSSVVFVFLFSHGWELGSGAESFAHFLNLVGGRLEGRVDHAATDFDSHHRSHAAGEANHGFHDHGEILKLIGIVEFDAGSQRVDESVSTQNAQEGSHQRGGYLFTDCGRTGVDGRHGVDDTHHRRDNTNAGE